MVVILPLPQCFNAALYLVRNPFNCLIYQHSCLGVTRCGSFRCRYRSVYSMAEWVFCLQSCKTWSYVNASKAKNLTTCRRTYDFNKKKTIRKSNFLPQNWAVIKDWNKGNIFNEFMIWLIKVFNAILHTKYLAFQDKGIKLLIRMLLNSHEMLVYKSTWQCHHLIIGDSNRRQSVRIKELWLLLLNHECEEVWILRF